MAILEISKKTAHLNLQGSPIFRHLKDKVTSQSRQLTRRLKFFVCLLFAKFYIMNQAFQMDVKWINNNNMKNNNSPLGMDDHSGGYANLNRNVWSWR